MNSSRALVWLTGLLGCCCAIQLMGQVATYGVLTGNVTDSSGSSLASANVTIVNTRTGVQITTTSNSQGAFEALNLVPGIYRVSISSPGFQTAVQDQVVLEGGRRVRVDMALPVGEVTQTIEVTASSSQINTETATTALSGITHKNTVTLPSQASATSVFPDVYNQLLNAFADLNNSAFSIGGTLSGQNAEVQDGMRIEGQPHFVGGNRGLARPGVEAVEELVVTTTSPSAKYPNPSAIEMVLKSGSNAFHGSLMYIHGNKALNASSYFTRQKQPFLLNQYFGSLGGPVIKNKTFFFFSFQGFHHPNRLENFNSVPTTKMREGDLSEFLDPNFLQQIGAMNPIVVTDPQTGSPFPNNQIPTSRISQVARNILEVYPQANWDEGRGYNRNFYMPGQLIRKERFNNDTRVDHYWTGTQHTYGRFSYFNSPNAADQTTLPGFGGNYFIVNNRIATVHHTSTITPNLINHIMGGMFRENSPMGPGLFETQASSTPWNQILGIAGIPAEQDQGFPLMSFNATQLTTPVSWSFGLYQNRIWHFRDDVTWTKGRHSIQFGVDFRHNNQGSEMLGGGGQRNSGTCEFGCLNFNGRWAGLDYADFLLGLPSTSTRRKLSPPDFRRRNELAFYIQDDIRLTSRLNLSLGLRYDYFPVVVSENELESVFDMDSGRLIVPSERTIAQIPPNLAIPIPVVTAAEAGFPQTLLESDKNNWGPRVGLAYRLMSNTVARAGFGIYHTPLVNIGRRLLVGPFEVTEDFPIQQPPVGGTPAITLENPYPAGGSTARPSTINFFGPERNPRDPRHYNYNFALERQFGNNAITFEFVGKKSIVPWMPERNTVPASLTPFDRSRLPYPQLGSILGLANGAQYNFHAFRIDARRRFHSGLFFNATYVFSKTIDDLGGISGETGGSSEDPFNRVRDRGENSLMPRHRMTINYVYQLPFGKPGGTLSMENSGMGKVVNQVIKGWEVGGTYNLTGSLPLTPTGNYLNALGQNFDAPNVNRLSGRPNVTGESIAPTDTQRAAGYVFNPNAFSNVLQPGTFGSMGRSVLNFGEGTILLNQSLFRNFEMPLFSRDRIATWRIGFLFYNFINHSNVPNPVVNMNSPTFGQRTTDRVGETRTITFQARLDF